MNNIDKAFLVAISAHKDRIFIDGSSYITHIMRVAVNFPEGDAFIVALLHDVINNGNFSVSRFKLKDFPPNIVEAVEVMTKYDEMDYQEYIERIDRNDLAREVMTVKLHLLVEAIEKLGDGKSLYTDLLSECKYGLSVLEE